MFFLAGNGFFGKPADEISITIISGVCHASTEPTDIQEDETIAFGDSLTINTFFDRGFSFRLQEFDSGLEGNDDYSQPVQVPAHRLKAIREAFDNGVSDYVQLSYTVTVKGANIFQENKWFGFLANNLCINALDFIAGPWTSKAVGKAILFKSGDMAHLYKAVSTQYKAGQLTKQSLFKALLTYQLRAGAKSAVLKPLSRNMKEHVKERALSKTSLDENLNEAVTGLKEGAVYSVAGEEGVDIYRAVNEEINTLAGCLDTLTDTLEFCLSEILPKSEDAVYDVYITVSE